MSHPIKYSLTCFLLVCIAIVFLSGEVIAGQKNKPKRKSKAAVQAIVVDPPVPLTPGFAVKKSEIEIPKDVPLGRYRRYFQPFPNWTLICDENLSMKKRICNITQTIEEVSGLMALSWSMAATETGRPFMILRVPANVGKNADIELNFYDGEKPVISKVSGCTASLCISYLPVGPRMRGYIKKKSTPEISYTFDDKHGTREKRVFRVPLSGLSEALAGI